MRINRFMTQDCSSLFTGPFAAHPLLNPHTFLGDAAFDSAGLYKQLLSGSTFGTDSNGSGRHFQKAYIPLNSRAGLENKDYSVNQDGIPFCPNDPSLPLKPEGTSRLRSGVIRYKFSCPKVKWEKDASTGKYHRVCHCENPCTSSPCGRMVYIYPEKTCGHIPAPSGEPRNGIIPIRSGLPWSALSISLKDSFGLSGRKTQNEKTLHADLLLAGITQLIGVILADKIKQHQYIRSLKPLIA